MKYHEELLFMVLAKEKKKKKKEQKSGDIREGWCEMCVRIWKYASEKRNHENEQLQWNVEQSAVCCYA